MRTHNGFAMMTKYGIKGVQRVVAPLIKNVGMHRLTDRIGYRTVCLYCGDGFSNVSGAATAAIDAILKSVG